MLCTFFLETILDTVYYGKLKSQGVIHSGDNLTGKDSPSIVKFVLKISENKKNGAQIFGQF